MDKSAYYDIRVEGRLPSGMGLDWLAGLDRTVEDGEITVLSGTIVDQSALFGVLNGLHSLHMTLVSVTRVERERTTTGD